MKTLQNDLTTIEQSKRLLELGVPEDSADCYYYEPFGKYNFIYILQNGTSLKETERRQRIVVHPDTKLFPCWSVGRLIEIIAICLPAEMVISTDEYPYVLDNLMQVIEDCIDEFDFSKLED